MQFTVTQCPQFSLTASWQRILNSLIVTGAYYEVFFAQSNSFLAISSQLFCQLPTPETLSILILATWVSGRPPQRTPLPLLLDVEWLLHRRVCSTAAQQLAQRWQQETPLFYCCADLLPLQCVYRAVACQWTIPVFKHHVTILPH
jgi:hypothetical protein